MNTPSRVSLRPGSIWIDGRPQILVSSSLFYFRIAAAEWRSRMCTLRALGYNAIDVYFPWNYHEMAPEQWDFTGQRDVAAFLDQAKAAGLWVIARPGPYICSEWDGGALPAHLHTHPDLQLRTACPAYLAAVRRWYDHIMPVLAAHQLDRDGAIVLVQLENELDFYACSDPAGLIAALRDMALAQGITVPLIACAGQGDISHATGNVDGVVPACNFYFDPRDPEVETRVRHYAQILRQRGYPLCVTETNRAHAELRRLIAGGAKLIGPYLQTGGSDFGFTTSVTNWGEPLSFMTTYYDFGGMISPAGAVRPEGQEAIVLMKMVAAFGPALALAMPQAAPPVAIQGIQGQTLALAGGGYLVALPNLGNAALPVTFGKHDSQFPVHAPLSVPPGACPFVLLDYPLTPSGFPEGRITYATAELVDCQQQNTLVELTFAVADVAELLIEAPAATLQGVLSWQFERTPAGWRLWTAGVLPAAAEIQGNDGQRLLLKAVSRTTVSDLRQAGVEEKWIASPPGESQPIDLSPAHWYVAPADPCGEEWFTNAKLCRSNKLEFEANSIWRGFGWYRTDYSCGEDVQGLLVRAGADVLSLYLGAHFLGTVVPGGGDAFVPVPRLDPPMRRELVVRAESWGHANFDDHRLPALRLNAQRGMQGLAAIHKIENITATWFYQHGAQAPVYPVDLDWPLIAFGGWSGTDEPLRGVYYHTLACDEHADVCILHFPGLQASAQVFVEGQTLGLVNPFNPYIDLSAWLQPGAALRLAIALEQDFRRPAGHVVVYQGQSIHGWTLAPWDEAGLVRLAQTKLSPGLAATFPLELAAGDMVWLHGQLPRSIDWERGYVLCLAGHGIKATILLGERVIGRIWLPCDLRPRMTGGAADRLVLPASWLHAAGSQLHLLLESVTSTAQLQGIHLIVDS